MKTQDYLVKKYGVDLNSEPPYHIPCDCHHDLPQLFAELGLNTGVEVGVYKGENSELLCQANPSLKLYSVDPWEFYPLYKNFKKQWQHNRYYKEAVDRLRDYNCEIIKKHSMEAVVDFEDESLDFVFIDGDHRFEYVTNDIAKWTKKVKSGGIISGHDFGMSKTNDEFHHVEEVVRSWTRAHAIKDWYILESRGRSSYGNGWMWIKQ